MNYSFGNDEFIVCLPSNDIFDYLNDYFNKSENPENQFLIDAYRSVIFYNCHMFLGEDNINELNQILKDTYEPILLKKIYCLVLGPEHSGTFNLCLEQSKIMQLIIIIIKL